MDDQPRLLKHPEFIARRRAELTKEHIAPLAKFAESLRGGEMGEIPDFDPWDGGTRARALFCLKNQAARPLLQASLAEITTTKQPKTFSILW
jgi:hypothetical protein